MKTLGVDVGGSRQPTFGIVEVGEVLARGKMPFGNFDEFVQAVGLVASEAEGIALALPGPIVDGEYTRAPNLVDFQDVPIASVLAEATGLPVCLYNDMSAAAAGMSFLLPDENAFLALTLSTGVGARVVRAGSVVDHDVELGHMKLDYGPGAPPCGCGGLGCVEAYLGGAAGRVRIHLAVEKLANAGKLASTDNWAWQTLNDHGSNPWACLDQGYAQAEPWAVEFYTDYARYLGRAISDWAHCHRFNLVVYKGSLALKMPFDVWKVALIEAAQWLTINPSWADIRVLPSPDPELDAVLGAVRLFEQNS